MTRLVPGGAEWTTIAPQLANKRLNASGTAEELVDRWVTTGCAIVRLTPAETGVAGAPDLPDSSEAGPPRETTARVETRRPFRLHKVRRR